MNNRRWDIAVIGAGPAGASTALELACAGFNVILLEGQRWPRHKPCGGGLTGRALRELPADFSPPIEQCCHRVEINLLDCGLTYSEVREEPLVTMTMRRDFDAALAEMAVARGAMLVDDCRVTSLEPGEAGVTLRTSLGPLRADLAVLADGAFSPLAKSLDWPDGRRMMPALEWEIPVDPATMGRFAGTARFDFGVIPDGYVWIFPKSRHLSAGITVHDARRRSLPQVLQGHLDRLGISTETAVLRQGHTIPVRARHGSFARQRLLLAGDAAGLADPLTGEGITFAVRSGRLAAAAIRSGRLDPPAVAARYERALSEQLLPELFYGSLLAILLYRLPAWRRWLFSRRGENLTRRMVEVMSGQSSYGEIFGHARAWWRLLGLGKAKAR